MLVSALTLAALLTALATTTTKAVADARPVAVAAAAAAADPAPAPAPAPSPWVNRKHCGIVIDMEPMDDANLDAMQKCKQACQAEWVEHQDHVQLSRWYCDAHPFTTYICRDQCQTRCMDDARERDAQDKIAKYGCGDTMAGYSVDDFVEAAKKMPGYDPTR